LKINLIMKEFVSTKYGPPEVLSQRDVLQLKELEKSIVKENEILIIKED